VSRGKIKGAGPMRDEERILCYQKFATIDQYSERAREKKRGKKTTVPRLLRPLKMAVILWAEAVKSFSVQRKW
jgi:hypothetical protein